MEAPKNETKLRKIMRIEGITQRELVLAINNQVERDKKNAGNKYQSDFSNIISGKKTNISTDTGKLIIAALEELTGNKFIIEDLV